MTKLYQPVLYNKYRLVAAVALLLIYQSRITITANPQNLIPTLATSITPLQSKITITVNRDNGSPASGEQIQIKTCTEIGIENTDGHIHDIIERGTDSCKLGSRPTQKFDYNGNIDNPITATTDNNGQIILKYSPPKSPAPGGFIIAGEDKIIASSIQDPSVKAESSITIKVPNLKSMYGCANCMGGGHS
jgi:hypothetical protein